MPKAASCFTSRKFEPGGAEERRARSSWGRTRGKSSADRLTKYLQKHQGQGAV